MAIHASFAGLGYQLNGMGAPPPPRAVGPLPECISAAKAMLASGKGGPLPAQCYDDGLTGPACNESCRDILKKVAAGTRNRMVRRAGPVGDKTCWNNAASMTRVICKNGTPVSAGAPTDGGAGMPAEAATSADTVDGGGIVPESIPYEEPSSPWPMRIGIGLGLGALVAGALYLKYGRG